MKREIVLFGAGGHAKVIREAAELSGFTILGVCTTEYSQGSWEGLPYMNLEEALKVHHGIVAIGDNNVRSKVVEEILKLKPSFSFTTVIHPTSIIASNVVINPGSVLLAGSILNSGVRVGQHAVINTGSIIEHDSKIEDFSFIGPGAVLGGNVTIGRSAFVGIGSTIIQNVSVGEGTLVGAGSTLVSNTPPYCLFFGNPAKHQRHRTQTENFL